MHLAEMLDRDVRANNSGVKQRVETELCEMYSIPEVFPKTAELVTLVGKIVETRAGHTAERIWKNTRLTHTSYPETRNDAAIPNIRGIYVSYLKEIRASLIDRGCTYPRVNTLTWRDIAI